MSDGADVYALPAMALYEGRMTPQTLQALIQDVAKRKGWLIFYTHEVTHQPGQWGATPELLRFCIAEAISAGCEVKTIRDAILYFGTGATCIKSCACSYFLAILSTY
jgi:hypothetical protein